MTLQYGQTRAQEFGATHVHIFLLLQLVNPQKGVGTVVFASQSADGRHPNTGVLTPGGPEIR